MHLVKKVNLAKQIGDLRKYKVQGVFNKAIEEFRSLPAIQNSTSSTRSTSSTSPRQQNLVAVAERQGTLVHHLVAKSDKLEVYAIVGPPGVGKTTLAWSIYSDPEIIVQYPRVIWVHVSQVFNVKDILLTILNGIRELGAIRRALRAIGVYNQDDLSTKPVAELQRLVCDGLALGKFLIIFDDVWTVQDWHIIKSFLPDNNGLRVLITTREHGVVREATGEDTSNLDVLNEEDSWKLLKFEVFGDTDRCPAELERIGKQLAGSCGGIPLIIVILGSTLRDIWRKGIPPSDKVAEWEGVLEEVKIDSHISIDVEGRLEKCLSLSYSSLRYDLKDCFLYMGMFPGHTGIPVAKITQLWIAEGFIADGRSMEKNARKNLEILIDKNLLEVDTRKPNGEMKTCRMHSYIRSFCKKQASDLFHEINLSCDGIFEAVPTGIIEDCRRICIHSSLQKFLKEHQRIQKARSFLSFSKDSFAWEKKELPCMSDAFKVLRILDVNMAIKFPKFPDNLSKLVLLNYVALSGNEFKVLPREIYKLWSIQTLEVHTNSPTLKIKANIWKMMELKHLKTKAAIILSKKKKGKGGKKLLTLNRLSPESCNENVFNKANQLKRLGIRGELSKLFDNVSSLRMLENLNKLKLQNELSTGTAGVLQRLPDILWFPANMKIVVLSGTRLKWTDHGGNTNPHLSTLAHLDNLEVLKLKDNAFMGDKWEIKQSQGPFKKLKTLHISDADFKVWEASDDETLKVLKKVVLKNCKHLVQLPAGDFFVTRLEMLHMDGVRSFAVTAGQKIKAAIETSQGRRIGAEFELVELNTVYA